MEAPESIHQFWFGTNADDGVTVATQAKLWWSKDDALDLDIKQRFAASSDLALNGKLDEWSATSDGCLALILLCDQFPRNMYRNTPQAFAFDDNALQLAKEGIAHQLDTRLRPIERVFFYLPFEHSESLADQDRAVALFRQLADEAKPAHKTSFENFLNFAIRHREVIKRFQRFPHRNKIVGRDSTAAELQFLSEPGSSF